MAVFGFLSSSLTASAVEEVCLRVFIGFRYLLRSRIVPRMNYVRIYIIYRYPLAVWYFSLPGSAFQTIRLFIRFFLHILRTMRNYFWNNFHKLNFVRKINWYGDAIPLEIFQFNLPTRTACIPDAFDAHTCFRNFLKELKSRRSLNEVSSDNSKLAYTYAALWNLSHRETAGHYVIACKLRRRWRFPGKMLSDTIHLRDNVKRGKGR